MALAEQNFLDVRLYDYILELFDQQRELVDSYTTKSVQEDSSDWIVISE